MLQEPPHILQLGEATLADALNMGSERKVSIKNMMDVICYWKEGCFSQVSRFVRWLMEIIKISDIDVADNSDDITFWNKLWDEAQVKTG